MNKHIQEAFHDELEKIGWVPVAMGVGRALLGGFNMLRGLGAAKGVGTALRGASTVANVGSMFSRKAPQIGGGFTQAMSPMMRRNPF